MKLFRAATDRPVKGIPYTPEEIDKHEYSERIWATVVECQRKAQEECQKAWDNGYWAGVHDRERKK